MTESPRPLLEWAHAAAPLPGQTAMGDRYVVLNLPQGALVGVMDGLGHGPDAAEAVQITADIIEHHAGVEIQELINLCHRALKRARGVALTIAWVSAATSTVQWAGVGNVEGRLLRGPEGGINESVLLRGGVVGFQLPPIRPATVSMFPGDTFIFATDGISPSFSDGVILDDSPQQIAERIMKRHNRGQDDALVLVGRYLGVA